MEQELRVSGRTTSKPSAPDSVITMLNHEAKARSRALQNAIFNSANFSSIATDAKGVIQIFNVGAERMLGYRAEEVVDKTGLAGICDTFDVVARANALSLELGTTISPGFEALVCKAALGVEDIYEITYIRKDGSRLPLVVSVTALRDAKEAIIGYLLVCTDNTARKQVDDERAKLDQRLRDQQYYTRSLIEANIDAIMTTDLQGIITDVNRQMEALTGCTRDELIGAPFKGFFTDPERAEESIKLVLAEGKITNYELTARNWDGRETVVSYNATTFHDRERRLQGVFAAARDITVGKRLDLELQERNSDLQLAKVAAEKANLSKSDFLSSMSHELRSPLNAILGFAQLMESETPPPSASQRESIGRILQAGWHLLNLINEILDLAKIESGKSSLSPEPVSLPEVLVECKGMVEGLAAKRGIELDFPGADETGFVQADRTRLKQILLNLLSNAIKYNHDDGSVRVRFDRTENDRIRIRIRDSGEGLAPGKVAQLFEPFNRLGQELGGEEGTGIGLVVAKQLVVLLGGEIGVESKVGEGCEFWFELHAAKEPRIRSPGPELPSVPQGPEVGAAKLHSILYVEDNPANLSLVEQLVARRPELVLSIATTGMQGMAMARADAPDLILMDINLPDIDGIEVLRILKKDPATSRIPIIAVSANAMPHDIAKGLKAGFLLYLTKPIKIAEFNATLDAGLEIVRGSSGESAVDAPAGESP